MASSICRQSNGAGCRILNCRTTAMTRENHNGARSLFA
jgi:hypothetical protein